jgi:molybdopterin molybdotransferase
MIDVPSAERLILDACAPLGMERVGLVDSVGRVLVRPVVADLDTPPFSKSMMDGYAIRVADWDSGARKLALSGVVTAGELATAALREGEAIQIMTGAVLPQGADAVVMLEETEADSTTHSVAIRANQVRRGQNILDCGSIYRRGNELLPAGTRITPNHVGLLAEAGCAFLEVWRRPSVGVITTGNEICSPADLPSGSQIRNSNGPLLVGLVRAVGGTAVDLGIVGDNPGSLSETIRRGLANDVLVLTGGVSAGMLDLVPRVMESLGVRRVFHKVSLKPGKPVWFGTHRDAGRRCQVFGLPGNPVSAFVCFHLFVRAALDALAGVEWDGGAGASVRPCATLACEHAIRGDRPTYWPSRLTLRDGRALVEPLPWKGSADQRCLSQANCLAVFPEGDRSYPAQSLIEVRWLA